MVDVTNVIFYKSVLVDLWDVILGLGWFLGVVGDIVGIFEDDFGINFGVGFTMVI